MRKKKKILFANILCVYAFALSFSPHYRHEKCAKSYENLSIRGTNCTQIPFDNKVLVLLGKWRKKDWVKTSNVDKRKATRKIYSTVIVANHEALAQVLEQVKLHFSSFSLTQFHLFTASTNANDSSAFASHRKLFKSSLWRFYYNWFDWACGRQKCFPSSDLLEFHLCHTRSDIRLQSNGVWRM